MAEVGLSRPGGLYRTAISLDWVLEDEVDRFSFTVNGPQPTMSRYIAYDTLNPPNPFLAITQDGRGNVVYDGGFPKFYNASQFNLNATVFSQLTGAGKYLHNAFNFCANPAKVAVGNKKILLLGDAAGTQPDYLIKATRGDGFLTSLQSMLRVAGYTGVFKDRLDYPGGYLNPTFAELDEYCCVFMMSSDYSSGRAWITDQAVTDMVSYREAGNGLIFITDHGANTNATLEQQDARPVGFYMTANRVMRQFGSFFTGNFDRVPVNIGFLRRTYGDHALYNGMSNSDTLAAGYSESKVIVATYPEYTKDTAPTLNFNTDGKYVVSVLAVMKDGTTRTFRYLYNVVLGEFLWWRKNDGTTLGDVYDTFRSSSDFLPYIESVGEGTLFGNILRNGKKIATFRRDDINGTSFNWFSGTNVFPVDNDDVFTIAVLTPFSYNKNLEINRFQPAIGNTIDFAKTKFLLAQDQYAGVPTKKVVNEIIEDVDYLFPEYNLTAVGNPARNVSILKQFVAGFVGLDTTAYIYPTTVATNQAKATLTTEPHCIIDAQLNQVFEYVYPQWVLVPDLTAQDFLGFPRFVTGITNGIRFRLGAKGVINRVN